MENCQPEQRENQWSTIDRHQSSLIGMDVALDERHTYRSDRIAFGNPVRASDDMQIISGWQLANFQEQNGRVVDEQQGIDQRQSEGHNSLFDHNNKSKLQSTRISNSLKKEIINQQQPSPIHTYRNY